MLQLEQQIEHVLLLVIIAALVVAAVQRQLVSADGDLIDGCPGCPVDDLEDVADCGSGSALSSEGEGARVQPVGADRGGGGY